MRKWLDFFRFPEGVSYLFWEDSSVLQIYLSISLSLSLYLSLCGVCVCVCSCESERLTSLVCMFLCQEMYLIMRVGSHNNTQTEMGELRYFQPSRLPKTWEGSKLFWGLASPYYVAYWQHLMLDGSRDSGSSEGISKMHSRWQTVRDAMTRV